MTIMNKRKIVLVCTSIIMLFLFSIINVVNATDKTFMGIMDDTLTSNKCIAANHFVTHYTTGKSVYVYGVDKHVNIQVVDVDGSIEADFDFYVNDDAEVGYLLGYSVANLDEDEVIVFATVSSGSAPWYNRGGICRVNMINYSHSEKTKNAIGQSINSLSNGRLSNIIQVDNLFYCAAYHMGSLGVCDFSLMCYDADTNTFTEPIENDAVIPYSATYVQNPVLTYITDDDLILWTFEESGGRPVTYHLNLETNVLTHLADAPSTGKMDYNSYFDVISHGFEVVDDAPHNSTHFYIYLVYTNHYVPLDSPCYDVIYFRQSFNNSFTTGNLILNSIKTVANSPRQFNPSYNNMWAIGSMKQNSLTEMYVWYEYYDYYEYPYAYYSLHKSTFFLGNNTESAFYDLTSDLYFDEDIEDTETDLEILGYNDLVYKEESSTFQVTIEKHFDGSQWVYYGQAPLMDYFTMTKSYSPIDVPLVQNKQYTFTYTFKNNGVAYSGGIVLIYVDDSLITSKITDSNGKAIVTMSFASIGYHTINIEFYKHAGTVNPTIEDETSYLVVSAEPTETPDYDVIGDTIMNVMFNNLPVYIVVLLPAYSGGKRYGLVGWLGGFVLGIAMAVQATLLPVHFAYLLALVIIMGFVFVIRGGGNTE